MAERRQRAAAFEARIERKHRDLPAFAVVPAAEVAHWRLSGTTTVEGTVDGLPLGRRSLHRWDERRWFVELRKEHLHALGKSAGATVELVLRPASTELPAELQRLIDADGAARGRWEARTAAQKRMLREEILAAKSSAARERRARRALLPPAMPKPARVAGLPAEFRSVLVRILARKLPGRSCGPYTEVAVGLPRKGEREPDELVPADARSARWETEIGVRGADGVPAFRGPAVHGPPDQRFLYLTWIGRERGAEPAMFRRAKLRLDAIPGAVLASALETGLLVGTLELTAPDGMPVCASVRPPAIAWSAERRRKS